MIRVFPVKNNWTPTDSMAFVGFPPLFLPPVQPVMISVVFTWDIPLAMRIKRSWEAHYPDVSIGGPAFGDPGGEFEPGVFIKEGVTITSRGCVRSCQWCFVPGREGRIREIEIKPGYIVQDNNLLACSRAHQEKVFDMLREQKKAAIFSGGIDARLLKAWHRELFDSIRFRELWFACDSKDGISVLERSAEILDGIPPRKRRCYVMIGFDGETFNDAEARLEKVYSLGYFPFCQLYQSDGARRTYPKEWRALQKKMGSAGGICIEPLCQASCVITNNQNQ